MHEPALPFASSLCGACAEVCPVKIDIPKVLLDLRADVKKAQARDNQGRLEQWAFRIWAWVMRHPRLYEMAGMVAASLAPDSEGGYIRNAPAYMNAGPIRAWLRQRDLAAPAPKSFPPDVARPVESCHAITSCTRSARRWDEAPISFRLRLRRYESWSRFRRSKRESPPSAPAWKRWPEKLTTPPRRRTRSTMCAASSMAARRGGFERYPARPPAALPACYVPGAIELALTDTEGIARALLDRRGRYFERGLLPGRTPARW